MRNFLATLCDNCYSLLTKQSPNLCARAFTLEAHVNMYWGSQTRWLTDDVWNNYNLKLLCFDTFSMCLHNCESGIPVGASGRVSDLVDSHTHIAFLSSSQSSRPTVLSVQDVVWKVGMCDHLADCKKIVAELENSEIQTLHGTQTSDSQLLCLDRQHQRKSWTLWGSERLSQQSVDLSRALIEQ